MAEQMRIDALRNPSGHGVLFDQLPQPASRVGPVPHGFKQVRRPLGPLPFQVLGELSTETLRKEDVPIFVPLALRDPQVIPLQINMGFFAQSDEKVYSRS